MKRKLPLSLLLSGIGHELLVALVVGAAGICFIFFGLLAKKSFFMMIGAPILLFYLYIGVVLPVRNIYKLSKEFSETEFDEIIATANREGGKSFYFNVVSTAEKRLAARNAENEEYDDENEYDEEYDEEDGDY